MDTLSFYRQYKSDHGLENYIVLVNNRRHRGALTKLRCSAHRLNNNNNNKKRSHTQLDSRKQVIAFQDRVMTINIKEAQHPLKQQKQVIDKSSIMLKISTKSMHRVLV